jgi:hypothetical protein
VVVPVPTLVTIVTVAEQISWKFGFQLRFQWLIAVELCSAFVLRDDSDPTQNHSEVLSVRFQTLCKIINAEAVYLFSMFDLL